MTLFERVTAKIRWATTTECWEFQSSIDRYGYGRISVDGKARKAHRVVYELMVGPIAPGMVLDHICQNRCCVNPSHLEEVSQQVNLHRIYHR